MLYKIQINYLKNHKQAPNDLKNSLSNTNIDNSNNLSVEKKA